MKKQSLLKKVISSIMVAIIVLGQFSSYNFISRAETVRVESEVLHNHSHTITLIFCV